MISLLGWIKRYWLEFEFSFSFSMDIKSHIREISFDRIPGKVLWNHHITNPFVHIRLFNSFQAAVTERLLELEMCDLTFKMACLCVWVFSLRAHTSRWCLPPLRWSAGTTPRWPGWSTQALGWCSGRTSECTTHTRPPCLWSSQRDTSSPDSRLSAPCRFSKQRVDRKSRVSKVKSSLLGLLKPVQDQICGFLSRKPSCLSHTLKLQAFRLN